MRVFALLILLLFAAGKTQAAPIVSDLSSHKIEIHSSFSGTQLMLFGARNEYGDIVVVVRGPIKDFTVRKKEKIAGIWVNRKDQLFKNIPYFYSISSSIPIDEIDENALFSPLKIGYDNLHEKNKTPFYEALLRKLRLNNLYSEDVTKIDFMGGTLFKTVIDFPDKMPRGEYTAEVYLFSDGELVSVQSTPIEAFKSGFGAFVYDTAHNHQLIYGIIAIFTAIFVGWFVSWIFNRN